MVSWFVCCIHAHDNNTILISVELDIRYLSFRFLESATSLVDQGMNKLSARIETLVDSRKNNKKLFFTKIHLFCLCAILQCFYSYF